MQKKNAGSLLVLPSLLFDSYTLWCPGPFGFVYLECGENTKLT